MEIAIDGSIYPFLLAVHLAVIVPGCIMNNLERVNIKFDKRRK